ncbi:MAG: FhaA domain-containing protein [Candidatus Nanopelagicales bacterium]
MSLLDQFEVQFNELSNGEIVDGELSEIQPVELAGIVNQEISRIQHELSPSEKVERISISLSSHDYKRLSKFETLLKDGLEDLIRKSGELKRIDSIAKTKIEIIKDSTLEQGVAKSVPLISFESPLEIFTEEYTEVITQTKTYILDINGLKKDLAPGTYTLGRGTEVDIQIHDPGISRKHLSITVDEKVIVKDLNSTNGTFLGTERVQELIVEDTITFRVGVTEIKIVSETR